MRRTLSQPGGSLFERGRWLLTGKDRTAAAAAFEDSSHESDVRPGGRGSVAAASCGLEKALDLPNLERPDTNPAAAVTMLDALDREPFDVAVAAARIAKASLLWTRGEAAAAESVMSSALKDWLQRQTLHQPGTPMEKEVAAIRAAVFNRWAAAFTRSHAAGTRSTGPRRFPGSC